MTPYTTNVQAEDVVDVEPSADAARASAAQAPALRHVAAAREEPRGEARPAQRLGEHLGAVQLEIRRIKQQCVVELLQQ